jgi:hypothetical protein
VQNQQLLFLFQLVPVARPHLPFAMFIITAEALVDGELGFTGVAGFGFIE